MRPSRTLSTFCTLLAAAASVARGQRPYGGHCQRNQTSLCVLHNVCLERDAVANTTTMVHYSSRPPVLAPAELFRWVNVSFASSNVSYDEASASARAVFRNTTLFLIMYQMHLPHYLEEEMAVLPTFHRWADVGLPSPPARVVNMLYHVSPAGVYKYDYHDAFISLYTPERTSADWEPTASVADVTSGALWDVVWARHVRPGDEVRPHVAGATTTRLCFDTIAFNAQGHWYYSTDDANTVRRHAAAKWGLSYAKDDVCILQRRAHRAIANLDDVVAWVTQRTGKQPRVFEMDRRPPVAQATLMSTCGVLITPHGANEVNMVFMPEDALVVELIPASYHYTIYYFKSLAASAGLRSHHVVVPVERLGNDNGCLASQADVPDKQCYDGLGECHWCLKQSNMTVIEADLDGLFQGG